MFLLLLWLLLRILLLPVPVLVLVSVMEQHNLSIAIHLAARNRVDDRASALLSVCTRARTSGQMR
jgi:hypothetical protein